MTLRNRTRRWINAAGGSYVKRASKVRSIGMGSLNAGAVLDYLLKGTDAETGRALGL